MKFFGATLTAAGLLLLGYFGYQTFFVPSNAYFIFALMMVAPFALAMLAGGIFLLVRSTRR